MSERCFWPLIVLFFLAACSGPQPVEKVEVPVRPVPAVHLDSAERISQYIRCIFQDRGGHLWFGTTTDGVVRNDGKSLAYFNASNGFGSDWVNAIQQDTQGDLWFATRDGVVRFDGSRFDRYTTANGLASDHVWSLLVDRDGGVWAGTYAGVSRYDGREFNAFQIPPADLSKHPYYQDPALVTAIVQDRAGDIWFATKGGAYRYSAERLTRFAEAEGLCSDFVNTILQQRDGRLLFGTRFGGLCSFNGHALERVMRSELKSDNVGMLYEDQGGRLWLGLSAVGLCAISDHALTCYDERDGAGARVVFCMQEDDQGRTWVGTGEGLYRYEPSTTAGNANGRFVQVTKQDVLAMGLR